jgi:hypothetical protein
MKKVFLAVFLMMFTLIFITGFGKRNVSVGDVIKFGAYEWQVLDVKDGKALLITQDITHVNMPYNQEYGEFTWEACSLRKWLNNDFFNSFSQTEQSCIAVTNNTNENNQWFGTNGGNTTQDKVFLLSIEEVARYFGDSGQLKNKNSDNEDFISDQFNQKRIAKYNDNVAWWWLRSPGYASDRVAIVRDDGSVSMDGNGVGNGYDDGGVRPALWLNL